MQVFTSECVLRLPRRIELLLGTVARGKMFGSRLHLARRSEGADENALGIGGLNGRKGLYRGRGSLHRDMPQLLPQHGGVDSQLLRNLLADLIAGNRIGHALNVRDQVVHRLHFSLCITQWKMNSCAIDQVIKIFLRTAQRRAVRISSLATDVEIRIESLVQGKYFDVESLFHQQTQSTLRRFCASRIGIEVDHNILAESTKQLRLNLGECCA